MATITTTYQSSHDGDPKVEDIRHMKLPFDWDYSMKIGGTTIYLSLSEARRLVASLLVALPPRDDA